MKNFILAGFAMAAAVAATPAQAVDLINVINLPPSTNTPYSFTFTAGLSSTVISFAGYQVPSVFNVTSIALFLNNTGPNLLGQTWVYTAAPSGALASQSSAPGVNDLNFAGVTTGSYDIFSQTLATTAGGNYTLSFLLTNSNSSQPSGFRVSASESRINGAVPEPATWAMMLVGFGALGIAMRRRRRNVTTTVRFA